ncbi:MAG: glycosyltransferase family 4 protein [Gammaproteobacteria bacterium]|nr:glycosyltransferase family 4 protein [Gammaproteobacteria bacterium]
MSLSHSTIRVLWFVNASFPAVDSYLGRTEYIGTGSWLKATVSEMVKCENIEIGIVWASDDIHNYEKFNDDKMVYYLIPQYPVVSRQKHRILARFQRMINSVRNLSYKREIDYCIQAVNDFKPDLIHIWGTENYYGLMSQKTNIPILIRFQGLLSVIIKDYWGGVRIQERLSMFNEALYYINMRNRAKNEVKIIKQNRYFEGRTLWDHSHLREMNATGIYYDIPVLMRASFYQSEWSINNINRHTIYITARSQPLKGNDCLIKAISIVRKYVPDIQLRIGGHIINSGYGKYLKKLVSRLGLNDCVTFMGPVSESEIINELLNTHVYVLSSYIENECNSLIEAQLVGVPCVAAYVGGIPSTIIDNETGLLFHKGDSAMLAMNIRKIFDDDNLAKKLSNTARIRGMARFNKDNVVNETLLAYQDIIDRASIDDAGHN